jgi:hypothetical protein
MRSFDMDGSTPSKLAHQIHHARTDLARSGAHVRMAWFKRYSNLLE